MSVDTIRIQPAGLGVHPSDFFFLFSVLDVPHRNRKPKAGMVATTKLCDFEYHVFVSTQCDLYDWETGIILGNPIGSNQISFFETAIDCRF